MLFFFFRAADDSYKAARTASSSDAKGSGKGKGRLWQSSVEAVPDDDAQAAFAEAQSLAAAAGAADNEDDDDDDAAYGPADEEGRFFGGGISRDTAELLDFIEQRDDEEIAVSRFRTHPCSQHRAEKPTLSDLKKIFLGFAILLAREDRRGVATQVYHQL